MPTFRLLARVAAPLSTFALVTASIGVSAAGAGGTTCEVVKEAEVERAVGHDVTAADPPQGVGGTCSFTVDGSPADAVNVWVLDGDDAKTALEVGKQIGGKDAVDVPKLGDDAIYLGDPLNTAYVLKDGTLVYLQYYVFSGDDSPKQIKRAVVAMTKKAIRRAQS
jgi:hypothetical protein